MSVRIDKWLWAARFFKTRGLAQMAIDSGRVLLGDARIKPAHAVKVGDKLAVTAGERTFEAENVVVATGVMQEPFVPAFAPELDPRIRQLHSNDYRNLLQLQEGSVLVVGAIGAMSNARSIPVFAPVLSTLISRKLSGWPIPPGVWPPKTSVGLSTWPRAPLI